MLDIGSVDAI